MVTKGDSCGGGCDRNTVKLGCDVHCTTIKFIELEAKKKKSDEQIEGWMERLRCDKAAC